MKPLSYAVTFYDATGEWEDRNEDFTTEAAARKYAEEHTTEGGYSLIEKFIPIEELRWSRKFKITKA